MNIGIDVDGVLTNIEKFQIENGKKYFDKTDEEIDKTKFEIKDIFHVTEEEAQKFWIKNIFKYCLFNPVSKDASDVIKLLKNKGNNIHIITKRVHTTKDTAIGKLFRKMLIDWLDKNGIVYDSITFCDDFGKHPDKLETCIEKKIDYMIEDDPENIKKLQNQFKVICINTSYNKDFEFSNNVYRVDEFSDVYSKLEEIENNRNVNMKFFKDNYVDSQKKVLKIGIPAFKLAFHPTIIDKEFIPEEGPVLLCGNHLHVWDQFPVICATDRVSHWMAKKEYFEGKLAKFFKATGAICVDRFGDPSGSKFEALNYLEIGGMVGLFPEGTRNHPKEDRIKELYNYVSKDFSFEEFNDYMSSVDSLASRLNILETMYKDKKIDLETFKKCMIDVKSGFDYLLSQGIIDETEYDHSRLLPLHYGAVSMAKKSGALIVPFGVTGDYTVKNDNLTVSFGKPIDMSNLEYEEGNEILRDSIIKLEKKNVKK